MIQGIREFPAVQVEFWLTPRYMQRDALVRCMLASCMQKVGVLSHIANTRHERSAYKRGLSLLFWNFETRTLEKSSLQIGSISRFLTCWARWGPLPLHKQLFFYNLLSIFFCSNNIFLPCSCHGDSCQCPCGDLTKIETIFSPHTYENIYDCN